MAQGFKRAKSPASSLKSQGSGKSANSAKQRLTKGAIQIKPKRASAVQEANLQRQLTAQHVRQTEDTMQARLRGQAGGIRMHRKSGEASTMESISTNIDSRALEAGERAKAKRQAMMMKPRRSRK